MSFCTKPTKLQFIFTFIYIYIILYYIPRYYIHLFTYRYLKILQYDNVTEGQAERLAYIMRQ